MNKIPFPDLDQKMLFFAQYYDQTVKRSVMPEQSGSLGKVNSQCFSIPHLIINSFLELKDVADITADDLKVVEDMQYTNILGMFEDKLELLPSNIVDFLRRKGYAMPFMGYSIEDMRENYWLKIVRNE